MMSEAGALVRLQEIDLEMARIRNRLSEMMELAALKEILGKIDAVSDKSKQVSAMRSDCEVEMQALVDEDEELQLRAAEIEEKIEESGEYREISNLTRELEGVAKRRNKVEFDHGKLVERVDKISQVEDQIADAMAKLEKQKASIEDDIRTKSADMNARLEELSAEFEAQSAEIGAETLERYQAVKASKNGIAVGVLQESHCSICRVELPEGKLKALLSGDEVAECPNCRRILVVRKG